MFPRTRPAPADCLLELSGGRIHSVKPDGSDVKTIVADCRLPDGIVVDLDADLTRPS
jgi:hypothetical protein